MRKEEIETARKEGRTEGRREEGKGGRRRGAVSVTGEPVGPQERHPG